MDKALIQKRTEEVLEKIDKPKEFTKGLQELLKSFVYDEATRNYRRIIPDTGKFYGVPKPILGVFPQVKQRSMEKQVATDQN